MDEAMTSPRQAENDKTPRTKDRSGDDQCIADAKENRLQQREREKFALLIKALSRAGIPPRHPETDDPEIPHEFGPSSVHLIAVCDEAEGQNNRSVPRLPDKIAKEGTWCQSTTLLLLVLNASTIGSRVLKGLVVYGLLMGASTAGGRVSLLFLNAIISCFLSRAGFAIGAGINRILRLWSPS